MVAAIHRMQLWQHDMALIHKQQKIIGEVIQQCTGHAARNAAGQHAGVVFDPFADAHLLQHFHIIHRALGNALGFDQLALFGKLLYLLFHFSFNVKNGIVHFFFGHNVVAGRENGNMLNCVAPLAGQR
ncbi:hypothetical protein SDC9_160729 [bioreactor metagenome]|uniref:Uncharacterized protein n=1 Tax=bioreactor metagenome TaxID=1076179 RepID=A0A645FG95_9ZZZZ